MERIHRSQFEDALAAIGIGLTGAALVVLLRKYLPERLQPHSLMIAAGGLSVTALTFAYLHSHSNEKALKLAARVNKITVGKPQ